MIIDFFMLIVDDLFDFGCIVVINVLFDVYVMGGKLIFVFVLVGMLINVLLYEMIVVVLCGGELVCVDVGILVVGGYLIDLVELIYGFVVIGVVYLLCVKCNVAVCVGDVFVFGKLFGVGVLLVVLKKN